MWKGALTVTLAAAITAAMPVLAACTGSDYPVYPPTSDGVIDATSEDLEDGKGGYLQYVGQRLRVLHAGIAVCQGMRFSRVELSTGAGEVGYEYWIYPHVEVVAVKHLKVEMEPIKTSKRSIEHWQHYVDLVIRSPSGQQARWIWPFFPGLEKGSRSDAVIDSDLVEDTILEFFAIEKVDGEQAKGPSPAWLAATLDEVAYAKLPEPPPAPSVESVSGEERAAALRLIALLKSSPGKGIIEAANYAKNYAFHEVTLALVDAIEKAPKLPDHAGNTYEQFAASALATFGDPAGVDALVRLLENPYRYNRRSAMEALGRIGSYRAMAALYKATDTEPWVREALERPGARRLPTDKVTIPNEERINALTALGAMCSILGFPESRDFFTLKEFQDAAQGNPDAPDPRLKYAALCYKKACFPMGVTCKTKLVREAVDQFKIFLKLEPQGPRAAVVRSILEATERLHGL